MLDIDESTLKAVTPSIDEVIRLVDGNADIRMVAAALGKAADKTRAMAEIKETPENRFISFVLMVLTSTFGASIQEKDNDWLNLNKDLLSQCSRHIKDLMVGMKSSFDSRSFEVGVDALKTFLFRYWQIMTRMTD